MINQQDQTALASHSHRFVRWLSFLLILLYALRRVIELDQVFSISLALGFIIFFTALYASQPWISQQYKGYFRVYLVLQMIIVQILGLFQEFLDTYALLYIVLGLQVTVLCPRKEAYIWFSLFFISLAITLVVEFGLLSGLGRALAYFVIGVFFISFDTQSAQHEDTLDESQLLLDELQEAHHKLEVYTTQVEKLAAIEERNRMTQELFDSVGQKVFAIQLSCEATRIRIGQDPHGAVMFLDQLQNQTQEVLSQMRQLINQWRPEH